MGIINLRLYHGTNDSSIKPTIEYNNYWCDFGQGFYLSPDPLITREWACFRAKECKSTKAYVKTYVIDAELPMFTFNIDTILGYVAEVVKHYTDKNFIKDSKVLEFINRHQVDLSSYSIICGPRADSIYNELLYYIINNDTRLSVQEVGALINLGNLGVQYCIKPELYTDIIKAESIQDMSEICDIDDYYVNFKYRIEQANTALHMITKGGE